MNPEDYCGVWRVTRGDLFPKLTKIEIHPAGQGYALRVTKPGGEQEGFSAVFNTATETANFSGSHSGEYFQISIFYHPLVQYKCIYGARVIDGNPEDAGVFGAEDDEANDKLT